MEKKANKPHAPENGQVSQTREGGCRVDSDLRTMNDGDAIHYTGTVHILSDIQSKSVIPTDANGHSVTNVVSVSLLSPYGLGSCRVNRILWLVKVKINPWLL